MNHITTHVAPPAAAVDDAGDCLDSLPQQSNHLPFRRPACLAHLPALPLYLMAAHWALLTGEVLTSAAVGRCFAVEPRRAQEVLRYLQRHPTGVTFTRLAGRRLQLRVLAVPADDALPPGRDVEPLSPLTRSQRETQRRHRRAEKARAQAQSRQWFLTRAMAPGKG